MTVHLHPASLQLHGCSSASLAITEGDRECELQ
jgi:hypothetical protein